MAAGRIYTVVISGVASPAAAFDFLEAVAAAGKPIRICRIRIAQTSEPTTEEEQLALTIVRGFTVSGSGGSAPTPAPVNPSDAAAGFTAETMNTTQANTSGTVVFEDAWNTRSGYDMAFAPEEGPGATGGQRLVIQSSAPADAVTIRATIWIEELG
jgi:hypothetical protein